MVEEVFWDRGGRCGMKIDGWEEGGIVGDEKIGVEWGKEGNEDIG